MKISRKLFFISIFVCFFSFFLTGCDAVYRLLQKEGAEEKDIIGEIVPFERNPQVEKVQKLLKLYGYTVGHPDGLLGANTRNAIAAFQEDNDLKISRFVDLATWEKLNVFASYGLVTEEGELNIHGIQTVLKESGLDPGVIDGKEGLKTEAAIIAFQKSAGLKPDGRIGLRTLIALAERVQASIP